MATKFVKSILYISFEADAEKHSGPSNHTFELSQAFADQGCKTTVITSGKQENDMYEGFMHIAADKNTMTGSLGHKLFAAFVKNIRFYIAARGCAKKCDVIYERQNMASFVGLVLSWRYRKPLCYEVNSLNAEEALSIHGLDNGVLGRIFNIFMRFQLRRARAVLVQTVELKQLVEQIYSVSNVVVVPNGATLSSQAVINIPTPRVLHCVYVGTIDRYHTLETILDVFSGLKDIAEINIIGAGENLNALKKKYSSESNIVFSGSLSHAEAIENIRKADIGLAHYDISSPTFRKFGFYFCPLKLLEYSANALPTIIIGASNSIINKFVQNGACRLIDDPSLLRQEVVKLYESPATISSMSHSALLVVQEFTWDNAARFTLEAFSV